MAVVTMDVVEVVVAVGKKPVLYEIIELAPVGVVEVISKK